MIASGVAYWTSRTEPCASAEADFEDTWNDTRRAAVQGGLAQTEGALAADTAPRAVAALDAYADRWIDARVEACRATHVEYAQSGELLDRSIGCLRRDERVFAALVDELVSGGDDAVEHAVDAVARLPSIARCRDLDTLLAEVEPPSDPDAARRVEALRGELARAEALEALGRYAEGAERVEPLRAEAEATGHGPVVASAALVHGRLLDGAGRPEVAAAALRHAAKIGRASGADETAAEAEVWLAFVIGYRLRRVDEGRWWAEHAEAAVQRSGTDGPLDGRLPAFRGVVEFAAGEVDTALPLLERGAKLLEERLGPDHPDTLEATYNLAVAHRRRGDLERARALHEVTRARREAKLGPTHPAVGTSLQAIGVVEAAAGDPTAAAALLERALRLLEDALGPQHPKVAGVLNDLGAVRFSQKRDEEAMACWARAERILVAALGPEHPDVQRSRRNRERAKAARSAPGLSAR